MTIDEIIERKKELDRLIAARVREFSDETGMVVRSVDITVTDATAIGEARTRLLYRCTARVELP